MYKTGEIEIYMHSQKQGFTYIPVILDFDFKNQVKNLSTDIINNKP